MDDLVRSWVLHVDLDQFIAAVEVLRALLHCEMCRHAEEPDGRQIA